MKLYHAFKGIAAVALLSLSSLSYAGNDTETDENGVILAGHDVIAYFKQNKPVLGMLNIQRYTMMRFTVFSLLKIEICLIQTQRNTHLNTVVFVLMA